MVANGFFEPFDIALAGNTDKDFVGAELVGKDFNGIVQHIVEIVQKVEKSRGIQGGSFVLNHLLAPTNDGPQTGSCSATGASISVMVTNIAGFEANQRHSFHTKGRNHYFARFLFGNRLIMVPIKSAPMGTVVNPIKAAIPRPDNVILKSLKKKSKDKEEI